MLFQSGLELFLKIVEKCFFKILNDGSDGSVKIKTLFSINPNYLLKIKQAENNYLKILFIGDSCFRKF